jgi:hypothetical protein
MILGFPFGGFSMSSPNTAVSFSHYSDGLYYYTSSCCGQPEHIGTIVTDYDLRPLQGCTDPVIIDGQEVPEGPLLTGDAEQADKDSATEDLHEDYSDFFADQSVGSGPQGDVEIVDGDGTESEIVVDAFRFAGAAGDPRLSDRSYRLVKIEHQRPGGARFTFYYADLCRPLPSDSNPPVAALIGPGLRPGARNGSSQLSTIAKADIRLRGTAYSNVRIVIREEEAK